MTNMAFVNGEYLPETEAKISIFDRGFLFADAIYEITSVIGGRLIDFEGHMNRLDRSLKELGMELPMTVKEIRELHLRLIDDNEIGDGLVYLQVTRGAAERDFAYPSPETPQSVVMFTQSKPGLADNPLADRGLNVVTRPDLRWGRRDIKTVQLLYASMAKMEAKAEGADDAWLVEDDVVTEGTSNNAYIVKNGVIVTRDLGSEILPGITRAAVLRCAREAQMTVEERAFTIEEAMAADEAFVTSATSFVMPVVTIDGHDVGQGTPGPVARRLREIYLDEHRSASGN